MRVNDLPMERFIQSILIMSGVGFLACILMALLLAMPAHAQLREHSPAYCAARVELAQLILEGMRDGTPIENINILFQQRAATPEMEQAREDWVAELKAEIVAERANGNDEDRIAHAIAARCGGTEI